MVIRRATAADAGPMAEVWLRSFNAALPTVRRPHGDDDVRAYFRDVLVPQQESWVAEDEGQVVGLLALDGDFVSQLYLDPAHRRQGIGTQLLDLAKLERPAGLQLWTFQVNTAAQAFYRHHGFIEVERTDGAGNQEREPDIRFEWHPGRAGIWKAT